MHTYVARAVLAQFEMAPIHWFLVAVGLVVAVMIVVGIISAGVARGVRQAQSQSGGNEVRPSPGGFPVVAEEDGPGTFRVTGVDRTSSVDVTDHIAAESAANARVKAELRGIVVTKIDRV
jgi:hypothetical protein